MWDGRKKRNNNNTPPKKKSLLNTLWQPTHSLLSVWRWRMPEPPPSSLSFQPHPANTETTNRSATAFKALARYICHGLAQAAFTSRQEASAEARSDAPWVTAGLGRSRRGQRQPQSAHSDLNKESVTFFFFLVYVRPFLWPHEPDTDMPQSAVFPQLEFWLLHTSNLEYKLQLWWKKFQHFLQWHKRFWHKSLWSSNMVEQRTMQSHQWVTVCPIITVLMPTLDGNGAFYPDKSPLDRFHSCDGERPPL